MALPHLTGAWGGLLPTAAPASPLRRLQRMTLLCAVLTDDAVLVSADGRAMSFETDPRFPVGFPTWQDSGEKKFLDTGVPSLMWGYSGISAAAKHLMDWAKEGSWSSWSQLTEDARKHSAKAVRTVKEQVRARQGDVDSPFLQFGVMFVGYLNGDQGLICIDENGIPQEGTERNMPMPWGGGAMTAIAAWNVLRALHPDASVTTPQELADFTNAVCDSVPLLDAPADVWRITPEGTEKCPVTYTVAQRRAQAGTDGEN